MIKLIVVTVIAIVIIGCSDKKKNSSAGLTNYRTYDENSKLIDTFVQQNPADGVISRGVSFLGSKYKYGGETPAEGFDCSGFVVHLFKAEKNISLPRTSLSMSQMQAPNVSRTNLKPGDLVFFTTNKQHVTSHVGIYMGDDKFIHSANKKTGVRIDTLQSAYWGPRYMSAKRVLDSSSNQVLAFSN